MDVNPKDPVGTFKYLEQALAKNFLVTCASKSNKQGQEIKNEAGILSSHCYAVL